MHSHYALCARLRSPVRRIGELANQCRHIRQARRERRLVGARAAGPRRAIRQNINRSLNGVQAPEQTRESSSIYYSLLDEHVCDSNDGSRTTLDKLCMCMCGIN